MILADAIICLQIVAFAVIHFAARKDDRIDRPSRVVALEVAADRPVLVQQAS